MTCFFACTVRLHLLFMNFMKVKYSSTNGILEFKFTISRVLAAGKLQLRRNLPLLHCDSPLISMWRLFSRSRHPQRQVLRHGGRLHGHGHGAPGAKPRRPLQFLPQEVQPQDSAATGRSAGESSIVFLLGAHIFNLIRGSLSFCLVRVVAGFYCSSVHFCFCGMQTRQAQI